MNEPLQAIIRELQLIVGEKTADVTDGHEGRWALYRNAVESGVGMDLIFDAMAVEPDAALASAVVVKVLEVVDDSVRAAWVAQVGPENRAFLQQRALELRLFEEVARGTLSAREISDGLPDWSNWLQLHLADSVDDATTLELLATEGRTKRIRNSARAKLKEA